MKKYSLLLLAVLFLFNCDHQEKGKSSEKLEIAFQFNPSEDRNVEPSYQLAVWLEDPEAAYIKTLFVSDYLSIGGYNDSSICPEWSRKVYLLWLPLKKG